MRGAGNDDPLFLQIKEPGQSVLVPHTGIKLPFGPPRGGGSLWGQRLTQGSPDIFVGWESLMGQISTFVSSRNRTVPPHSGHLIVCPITAECVTGFRRTPSRDGDAGYCGRSDALDQARLTCGCPLQSSHFATFQEREVCYANFFRWAGPNARPTANSKSGRHSRGCLLNSAFCGIHVRPSSSDQLYAPLRKEPTSTPSFVRTTHSGTVWWLICS